jgi:hypothetical protein
MDSRFFYRELAILPTFEAAADGSRQVEIPDDWFVIVTDIAGSTKAIEQGRYKDVNTVGAATIMAVINVDRDIEIPFIFGGDGATVAIPFCMVEGARRALLGAKEMARDAFNLDLRVGLIAAGDIYRQNLWLRIAKYRHSDKITQTSISGFGWVWAESVLKNPDTRSRYEVVPQQGVEPAADFTGFECRWNPVPAVKDFKLAMIVQCMLKNPEDHFRIYAKVLRQLKETYGDVGEYHPLRIANLGLTYDPRKLMAESRVYATGHGLLHLMFKLLSLLVISFIGNLAFSRNLKIGKVRWGGYRREVVENSDFRKFDGALKMVVDSSIGQEAEFRAFLDRLQADGDLVFGMHRSRFAIMTCLVFTPGQDHAHFVDGSDGGYALAAKELKAKLKRTGAS